jgi:hypothetical protein
MKITADLIGNQGTWIIFDAGYDTKLEQGKKYNLEIKEHKTARSLEQNRMMWKIIQTIAKTTDNDETDIYIKGLEHANIKADFILGLPEIESNLRKMCRAVKIMESREINGKTMLVYKIYIGSSKFNVMEMTELIEFFIRLAAEYNIDI